MKEYKCIQIEYKQGVEDELNLWAKSGWRLVCPSCVKWWFILEREVPIIKSKGKRK